MTVAEWLSSGLLSPLISPLLLSCLSISCPLCSCIVHVVSLCVCVGWVQQCVYMIEYCHRWLLILCVRILSLCRSVALLSAAELNRKSYLSWA